MDNEFTPEKQAKLALWMRGAELAKLEVCRRFDPQFEKHFLEAGSRLGDAIDDYIARFQRIAKFDQESPQQFRQRIYMGVIDMGGEMAGAISPTECLKARPAR